MKPRDVPALRMRLMEENVPYRSIRFAEDGTIERKITERDPITYTLSEATLWWVSAEMVDMILHAAAKVPDDVTMADFALPSPFGLVVLDKPWVGIDSENENTEGAHVHAFAWTAAHLERLAGRPEEEASNTLSMISYTHLPEPDLWIPLGRSDWPIIDPLGRRTWPTMDDQMWASMREDRQVLFSFFRLIAEKGIATRSTEYPDRAERRRVERTATRLNMHRTPGSDVNVVLLREPERPRREAGDDHAVAWSCRWPVEPHWHRYAVGKGRARRELRFVGPYIKGPADKPLRTKEKVHAVVR